MKITKENKGVTLVVLIITIILMIIIAGVAVYVGTSDIDNAKDGLLISELNQINHFAGTCYLNYMRFKSTEEFYGTKLTAAEVSSLFNNLSISPITIPDTYNEDEKAYYRVTPALLETLGIEKCQNNYVINYITGETINETKLTTSDGTPLYLYSRDSFNEDNSASSFNQPTINNIDSERSLFNSL